jgi:hypothetical protein
MEVAICEASDVARTIACTDGVRVATCR